jgi:hypothetical protein
VETMNIVLGIVAVASVAFGLAMRGDAQMWRELYRTTDDSRDAWAERFFEVSRQMRALAGVERPKPQPARKARRTT